MRAFNDRRPAEAVPKISLRSKAALEAHMSSHHGMSAANWSHSELREAHQEHHTSDMVVIRQPHQHENARYVNPPDED